MQTMTDIAVVPVDGDLDVTTVPALRRFLDSLIDRGCRRVILNLARTDFVDSAGMALILSETRHMRSVGGLLSITNVNDRVYRALRRVRIVDYIPVSGAGSAREVPELDPRVEPVWRRILSTDAAGMSATRGRVEALLRDTPLSDDEIFDMTLACGEALGNAFDHTDSDYALVTVAYYPDRVNLEVTDQGKGYQLAAGEEPHTTCASKEERGRGIRLMRMLADEVTICLKSSGRGTSVRLVKLVDKA